MIIGNYLNSHLFFSNLSPMNKFKNDLVTVIAVNKLVKTPIPTVRANPLTIDEVKIYKTAAPIKVVTWLSLIDSHALVNPSFIDCFKLFCLRRKRIKLFDDGFLFSEF